MGLLRLYLAVFVVGAHAGPVFDWPAHDGHQAVQLFFLISGFYMAMVYGSKYTSPAGFYASRFLRIYLPYAVILMATVLLSLFARSMQWRWIWTALRPYVDAPFDHNGAFGVVATAVTNLTLFFQDWVMFFQHDAGHPFSFTSDFTSSPRPLYHYLLVPQAWSIGVELTFYLMVPLLSGFRSSALICIVVVSTLARLAAYRWLGLARDPWEYRLFPFEIALFALGMLSYRLSRSLSLTWWQPRGVASYALGCLALLTLFAVSAQAVAQLGGWIGHHHAVLLSYLGWAVLLPLLFRVFGQLPADRFIGELSYPVYLSHLLVVSPVGAVVVRLGWPQWALGPATAVVSVVCAALLYLFILAPMEARRFGIARRLVTSSAVRPA